MNARLIALGLVAAAALPRAQASEWPMPAKLYEVTTETVMPHLEENLRYATIHEKRCLSRELLASAFPILHHPALQGCRLDDEGRHEGVLSYLLLCPGSHSATSTAHTTGTALWRLAEQQITGRLDVKLGGKNMTFYQQITATPISDCSAQTQ